MSMRLKTLAKLALPAIIFLVIIATLYQLGYINEKQILNWDALHYQWIKNNGYDELRSAFFPALPLLWKSLSLNAIGIASLNGVIFITTFSFISYTWKLKLSTKILYACIPSTIFFFFPYSESLFFLSSALLLYGLKKDKTTLVLVALFLCSVTRPAFTIFLPALFIVELFAEFKLTRILLKKMALYIAACLLGLLVVSVVQYNDTGKLFAFFEAQKIWDNKLQIPTLPLRSWAHQSVIKLDGLALLTSIVSGITVVTLFIKRKTKLPKELIFSLSYLAGIGLSVLLFRGGSLFSLNRFVFATPFFLFGLHYFFLWQKHFSNIKQISYLFLFINIFWLLFGSYMHIQTLLSFILLSLIPTALAVSKNKNSVIHKTTIIALILSCFIFQIYFLIRFINAEWVA